MRLARAAATQANAGAGAAGLDDGPVDEITPEHIESVVARMARIPAKQASSSDKDRLKTLEESLGRVVFGQTERDLKAQTGAHEENPTLDLPCHVVFEAGQRPTELVGPLLPDEAAQLQADFWDSKH